MTDPEGRGSHLSNSEQEICLGDSPPPDKSPQNCSAWVTCTPPPHFPQKVAWAKPTSFLLAVCGTEGLPTPDVQRKNKSLQQKGREPCVQQNLPVGSPSSCRQNSSVLPLEQTSDGLCNTSTWFVLRLCTCSLSVVKSQRVCVRYFLEMFVGFSQMFATLKFTLNRFGFRRMLTC